MIADDISSPGDNIPDKKESIIQKIKRYESSGFYIAVPETAVGPLVVTPADIRTNIPYNGDPESCGTCFADKSAYIANKLNDAFGTTIFETIEQSNIPTKEQCGVKVPDYSNTKYKLIVTPSILNTLEITDGFVDTKGKLTATYRPILSLNVTEYVVDKGKDKVKQEGSSAMGLFGTETDFVAQEKVEFSEVADWPFDKLKAAVNWPTDEFITSAYEKALDEALDKLVEKLKK